MRQRPWPVAVLWPAPAGAERHRQCCRPAPWGGSAFRAPAARPCLLRVPSISTTVGGDWRSARRRAALTSRRTTREHGAKSRTPRSARDVPRLRGKVAQRDQRGGRDAVSGRRGVVRPGLGAMEQFLVVVAGEETAALAILEVGEHGVRELARPAKSSIRNRACSGSRARPAGRRNRRDSRSGRRDRRSAWRASARRATRYA
jgi:hypothetical protein